MLRLVSIDRRYGRQPALSGVSLHVRPGDCYGFLGHNGAGKTTALRIALGLIRPDRGRVIVDGFDAAEHPREARARQGGLIETPGFYPWLSGRRNLAMLARLRGLDRAGARREADRLLEEVGLSSAGDRSVGGYSQGMRQRLGIAQALIGDPALVLLDEPTNGLDPEGIEEFRRLLVRLTREEGRTVLLSSHQLRELSDVCNRIGILRQGRLLVEGETAGLLAGGGSRFELSTDDPAAAREVLAGLGIPAEAQADGRIGFEPGGVAPAAVAKALVARDLEVRELRARTENLEDLYLRVSRSGEAGAAVEPEGPPAGEPRDRRAPSFPVWRAFRHEVGRLLSHPGPIYALLLPALVAALSVALRWGRAAGHLAEVAASKLISTSRVTAFEGATEALHDSLPVAALVLAGLASQSLAGEYGRGTLRNLLLTPVGRWRLAFGKALGLLAVAAGAYVALAVAAIAAASVAFDFTDVVELLENYTAEPYVLVKASELWPAFRQMVPALAVPLLAYASFGLLAGAIFRGGASALAFAVGGVAALDLGRVAARELGVEPGMLSAYLPSPLGDTSWTRHVLDMVLNPNSWPGGLTGTAVTVPLAWLAACTLLAAFILSRRNIP